MVPYIYSNIIISQVEPRRTTFPTAKEEIKPFLFHVWRKLTNNCKGRFYAATYGSKKPTLIIGRLVDVEWEGEEMTKVTLDCFKTVSVALEECGKSKDKWAFNISEIIAGPLDITFIQGRRWEFPDYFSLEQYFRLIDKTKELHDQFVSFKVLAT